VDQSKSSNGLSNEQFVLPKAEQELETAGQCKIYLLKRIFSVGYDEFDGKVVIAPSAKAARKLANMRYGDEGPVWADPKKVFCQEIDLTVSLVVLESFKAG
jgi:hypothetical protein